MPYLNNSFKNYFIKAWIAKYPSLYFIILSVSINFLYSQDQLTTPESYSIGFAYGIAYISANENYSFPQNTQYNLYLTNRQFNFINVYIYSNSIPYISLNGIILYSLDFSTNYFNYTNDFKYSRYSINLRTFESFLKGVTVHPNLGIGIVQIILKNQLSSKNINSINFNIGGGIDSRIKLYENEKIRYNLLQSINLLYSIMLKEINNYSLINNNTSTFEINFSISLELQKKGEE